MCIRDRDKKKALKDALAELNFFYGKRTGSAQTMLKKVVSGKDVSARLVIKKPLSRRGMLL